MCCVVRRIMGIQKYTANEYKKMKENWQELKRACRYCASQAIKREMISAANAVHDIPGEQGKDLKGYKVGAQTYDAINRTRTISTESVL